MSYPTSSSISFGVLSVLTPRTLTLKSTEHSPGGVETLGGISSCGDAVKMIWFTAEPPPGTLVVQVVPAQVVVMAASPSYSTSGPSSVHGGVSGSFALQSRLNWKLWMMSLVPFWMLPVPKSMWMSLTSPMLETAWGGW